MNAPYNYVDMLQTVRNNLDQEPYQERNAYMPAGLDEVQPLVILIEEFLRKERGIKDPEKRRKIRLMILSQITRQAIGTTYDLTGYQCTTIRKFLIDPESGLLTDRTKRFLGELARQFESIVVGSAR